MNNKIVNIVKYSKVIYFLYFYIGSFLLRLARLFVNTDEKLIVFVSFGGRKFDDSPRCIYEKMIEIYRELSERAEQIELIKK